MMANGPGRAPANKRWGRGPSESSYRFQCDVVYDVYGNVREKFQPPPVEGLDDEAIRPLGRHEVPERFGRNVLPPSGIPDPAPDVMQKLLHANYVYRVRVVLSEPKDLSYLAASLTTAASLCKAVDGVIRDTRTHLVLTYDEARRVLKTPSFDIADHVLVHTVREPGGTGLWLHTHGLGKFGRADLEIRRVPQPYAPLARHALLTIGDYLSQGKAVKPGETLQLGPAHLCFTRAADEGLEEFPYGVIRVSDFDPETLTPADGVVRWLTTVLS